MEIQWTKHNIQFISAICLQTHASNKVPIKPTNWNLITLYVT